MVAVYESLPNLKDLLLANYKFSAASTLNRRGGGRLEYILDEKIANLTKYFTSFAFKVIWFKRTLFKACPRMKNVSLLVNIKMHDMVYYKILNININIHLSTCVKFYCLKASELAGGNFEN